MREIKFRFYSNHLKKFVIPDDDIFIGALKDPDMNPTQFTGLRDKNNIKIYERDIVRGICSDNPTHVCQGLQLEDKMGKEVVGWIDYSVTYAQFRFTTNDITYLSFPFGLSEPEVIGNCYENPDLLEKTHYSPDCSWWH